MLLDFFYSLRQAKLPVSVTEYLSLLAALQKGVIGPSLQADADQPSGPSNGYGIDDFYYLSRTALVKDEKHYDRFDRAFAAYFKGVERIADFTHHHLSAQKKMDRLGRQFCRPAGQGPRKTAATHESMGQLERTRKGPSACDLHASAATLGRRPLEQMASLPGLGAQPKKPACPIHADAAQQCRHLARPHHFSPS